MRRSLAGALLVALLVGSAWAEEAKFATPPLTELDALRIEKLAAERRALEERFGRLQSEAQRAQSEGAMVQELWQAKGRELDQTVEAAAAKVPGVTDPKAWLKANRPDVGTRTWRPVEKEGKK